MLACCSRQAWVNVRNTTGVSKQVRIFHLQRNFDEELCAGLPVEAPAEVPIAASPRCSENITDLINQGPGPAPVSEPMGAVVMPSAAAPDGSMLPPSAADPEVPMVELPEEASEMEVPAGAAPEQSREASTEVPDVAGSSTETGAASQQSFALFLFACAVTAILL